MSLESEITLASVALLVGMLVTLKLGLKIGARHLEKETGRPGGMVPNAAFALLGLLTAFSFYGATGRLDWHRQLTVDEANSISTAYHRIDLLPAAARPALRQRFAAYLDNRIELYRQSGEPPAVQAGRRVTVELQSEIRQLALAACPPTNCPPATTSLVFSSLDTMADLSVKQMMGTLVHPPAVVFVMLFAIALICTYLVGFDLAGSTPRSWAHLLAVPVILTVIIFVVLDVEFPRRGLIRLDDFDRLFVIMRERISLDG
jgi:hypothetical protein